MKKSTNRVLSDENKTGNCAKQGLGAGTKLVSMTDFVLEQITINQFDEDFTSKVVNYANFLKQPLKLGMFIPCDDNDVPIEKPVVTSDTALTKIIETKEYLDALDKVIFPCLQVQKIPEWNCYMIYVTGTREKLFRYSINRSLKEHGEPLNVEDLVKYGLTLNLVACT